MFRHSVPSGYYIKSALKIVAGGTAIFAAYEFFDGGERFYREFLIPAVHKFVPDPEKAHRLGIFMARYRLLPERGSMFVEYPTELSVKCFGLQFKNPVGLAAGFDKDGEAVDGLCRAGFGFVEIGSVTPRPQTGNERPRIFRLSADEAVINRYGFNSAGHSVVETRLKNAKHTKDKNQSHCVVGVNLGKNKDSSDADADFSLGLMTFAPHCDYIVINVSSPNTPGLRDMQSRDQLKKLLQTIIKTRRNVESPYQKVPLLLKVSPDLTNQERADVARLCLDQSLGVDGLIVSNTTVSRPDQLKSPQKLEIGGLSGRPLRNLSTECVKDFRKLTAGRIPIIASGGISNGADAYEKIRAGATLVQFYTALVYQGFPVLGRIKRELVECLKADGFTNISEAIGRDCPLK